MGKKLTQLGCEKAKPWKRNAAGELVREELPDEVVTGLYFVLQPSGVKSWAYRYRFAGKPAKFTLGPFGSAEQPGRLDVSAARDAARAAADKIERGIDPAAGKRRVGPKDISGPPLAVADAPELTKESTVSDCWDRFLATHLEIEAKADSIKTFRRVIVKHTLPKIGERAIASIVSSDVKPIVDRALTRGKNAKNSARMALNAFFNWCVENELLDAAPNLGRKVKTYERERFLEDHEVKSVLRAFALLDGEETSAVKFGALFKLLLLTGCRRNEVARMKRSEVDFTALVWTLPRGRSKTAQSHRVYLTPTMTAILKSLPRIKDCDYFFSANGKSPASGFSKAKARLDKLAVNPQGDPIAGWRLHDLRRTCRTGMGAIGILPHIAEFCINHKVKGYDRGSYAKDMREAWRAWDKHVAKLAPKVPITVKPRPIGKRGPWARLLRTDGPKQRARKPESVAS